MKNISARDYDLFTKPELPFEQNPVGSDFYISDNIDGFSWSTNGKTIESKLNSITRATSSIKRWAQSNNASGKVWFMDGTARKYIGQINGR